METIRELTKLSTGKELDIEYPIRLYNNDGDMTYYEDAYGYWQKRVWQDGKEAYFETEAGYWCRSEYQGGERVYFEDSTGYIKDNREPAERK